MTSLLQQAIAQIETLPADEQDRAAEVLLALAADTRRYRLTLEQVAGVELAMRQADDGRFASSVDIRRVLGRDL